MKVVLAILSDQEPIDENKLTSIIQKDTHNIAIAELGGIPIFTRTTARWHLLTGVGPGQTGMFDDVEPNNYCAVPTETEVELRDQAICRIAQHNGKSVLRTAELPDFISNNLTVVTELPAGSLERLFAICDREMATLLLVQPYSRDLAHNAVNINNFLREKQLLESDSHGRINWQETLAYHMGLGQVWINLLGREPKGIVFPGQEYEDVRSALIELFHKGFRDPESGQSVVEQVYRKEELYDDNEAKFQSAPDLVIIFQDGFVPSPASRQLTFDSLAVTPVADGLETLGPGTMIARGTGVQSGWTGEARLVDVVPIILALLGLLIPNGMGQVPEGVVDQVFLQRQPIQYEKKARLSTEDEAALAERLRALGYLAS